MPNGAKGSGDTWSGTLYRTTGPAFNASPWNPLDVAATAVGTATFAFTDGDNGTFSYTVNGLAQSKAIVREAFASPTPTCVEGETFAAATNYSDLWWRSPANSESGWGINITHQGDVLFATWFTYGATGKGEWLVMSNGAKTAPGSYTGALYRTTGSPYSGAWNPSQLGVAQVGTATFTFTDIANGTFTYSVDGVSGSKAITREAFSSPGTVCN